jgi:thiamine biosynthesis lipoprotein
VIVSLGGDVSAVSRDPRNGWQVLVSDTDGGDLDAPGQVVTLRSGGMATSSTRHRRWTQAGTSRHHIVDPRTGQPAAEVLVTATVCAPSCVDANAASTAAIILGEQAAGWLESRDMSALLVEADGSAVRCARWPAPNRVGALC